MKKIIFGICASVFLFSCSPQIKEKEEPHYLSFADTEALYDFYSYRDGAPLIIQGHRGTRENGLPENSIGAFEYVLTKMPAVFEIDPRLTKDSVIIVFHDATLDRTTNGTGKVIDYTWKELQQLNLKNNEGEVTEHKIPTLAEVFEWANGKTALLLDKKDVPLKMIADLIREHDANNYVISLVRSPGDAAFYFNDEPKRMFAISFREPEAFQSYLDLGIPKRQIFACIGTKISEKTNEINEMMRGYGIRSLISAAPTYDKLETEEERAKAYRKVIESGITILESDYPVGLRESLSTTSNN
ncbi:glycerophosphodiester phosphodiesterase family protein [Sphingobacterium chuzhouense]|uniref:Glycerophosphodiester phosphodiesterase family protein n=1 Tax=Sphingobacterium chuzhouense TaxID=1742264 RepID=A0ABR7XW06_9SPHI|nr:glycerophosphodiester phosphodiesterase family protein [Sphingobacterium chuzhouense]MBD1423193.1 glycerophosphodiester phosphodiesterase family protein [Sphingobacterium chuzhouense]